MISSVLLTELYAHQAWADSALFGAVAASPSASSDTQLLALLHHIVVVQRFFTTVLKHSEFDMERERKPPESLDALEQLSNATNLELLTLVKQLDPATLDDTAENPRMPDLRSTVAETLLQIIMHSQNHRGQALMLLRQLTGNAPTLDFILWVKLGQPNPVRVSDGEPRTASESL